MPEVDMSIFSKATLIANAVKALQPDIPYLNEIERKTYATAVNNWKLNKAQGASEPIPDPPLSYVLRVDYETWEVAIMRGTEPVCAKYVDESPAPAGLVAGAIVPPFAAGRYLCVMGDNAPAGYKLTTSDGVQAEKVITPWFAGVSQEYRKVA